VRADSLCVCVCVCERERERESVFPNVCVVGLCHMANILRLVIKSMTVKNHSR